MPKGYYDRKVQYFWPSRTEPSNDSFMHKWLWVKDPGPSWKKFKEENKSLFEI